MDIYYKIDDRFRRYKTRSSVLDKNTTGQSQTASGSGTIIEELKQKLIARAREMFAVASALPSTVKQAQNTGISCGFSISKLFGRPKNVQVYSAVDTPKDVDTALMKLCKAMSYECKIIKHILALQHGVPLIVVCPVTSRLEPDIDHALNGLDWQSLFIVLVLHQGNEHSLPRLPTATRLLGKTKYENAEFVDMAYSLEFYTCKMNEDAKQKLKEMFAVASALPSTVKQAQNTGISCGFSISKLFGRPKNVQVYSAVDTPKDVDTALMKLCKAMSYECKIIKHILALQHDVPLIVVCPVTSRLEPDIDHALNGLDWQSPFIVLVLHRGNEHSLPGLSTETRLPEKPEYAEFVDMAYSLEFYACKMNEDAKRKIKAFVGRKISISKI